MATHGTSPTNAAITRAKAVTMPAPAFAPLSVKRVGKGKRDGDTGDGSGGELGGEGGDEGGNNGPRQMQKTLP